MRSVIAKIWCIATLLSCCITLSYSYFVNVDASSEECFFENAARNSKLTLTYEVADGGFLDIDVNVVGPTGNNIYSQARKSNDRFAFTAQSEGVHKYCFSNKMSSMTPKLVMFTLEVGESRTTAKEGDDDSHNKLAADVNTLSDALLGVKHEQEFMEVRERVHRAINDNTNSRVVLWAFFEALVLVAMVLGQIYYLKRFFEVRRVI